MPGRIRIIGGKWRGRKIPVVGSGPLRPTPDRIRETLFNWLQPYLPGARCLDLFAGTGALGLEAASRGADQVVLVEREPELSRQLEVQVHRLGAGEVTIHQADALVWLPAAKKEAYDIIFLDPPFGLGLISKCLEIVVATRCLARQGLVYVESERPAPQLPLGWYIKKQATAGHVHCMLLISESAKEMS